MYFSAEFSEKLFPVIMLCRRFSVCQISEENTKKVAISPVVLFFRQWYFCCFGKKIVNVSQIFRLYDFPGTGNTLKEQKYGAGGYLCRVKWTSAV